MVTEKKLLVKLLNAIINGGPVPQAALDVWPHKRLVSEGYVTVRGNGARCRYFVTYKGTDLILEAVQLQPRTC